MLTKRIIPCLDVKDGRVVKGVSFVNLRDAGDPVEVATVYDREGADELCFLDITASHENRKTIIDVVEQTAAQVFMPLTVGVGVRTLGDIRARCQGAWGIWTSFMADSSRARPMRCWPRLFSIFGLTRFQKRRPIFVRREWWFDNGCGAIEIRWAGTDSGSRAGLAGWHSVDGGIHEPGVTAEDRRDEVCALLEPFAPKVMGKG